MLIAAHISGINGKGELVYEQSILEISAAERKFFCEGTILLEIEELLSCADMIQRCQVSLGRGDPMAPFQSRIKQADSMREKLERHGLPITTDSALKAVWAAAGSRLVCPFVQNIYQTTDLIRAIPGVRIQKDSNHEPKPNGYRSYHMILSSTAVPGAAAQLYHLAGGSASYHCHGLLGLYGTPTEIQAQYSQSKADRTGIEAMR